MGREANFLYYQDMLRIPIHDLLIFAEGTVPKLLDPGLTFPMMRLLNGSIQHKHMRRCRHQHETVSARMVRTHDHQKVAQHVQLTREQNALASEKPNNY